MSTSGDERTAVNTPARELSGLAALLDEAAQRRPEATALIVGDARVAISYRQLAAAVATGRGLFEAAGLLPRQRIALQAANTVEFIVALLAAARAGLVVAPLDPMLTPTERDQRLTELTATHLVMDPLTSSSGSADPTDRCPSLVLSVDPAATTAPEVNLVSASAPTVDLGDSGAVANPDRPRHSMRRSAPTEDTDYALIMFTGGTTARPKLVPLTNANVAVSIRGICATYDFGSGDATVATMPFFHGHGLFAGLLSPLASGGALLLPRSGRFTAHTFWDDAKAVRATWFTAVPTILTILLARAATEYPGPDCCELRFIRSCSAPLDAATAAAVGSTFHAPVLGAYGMTETTHQAASQPLPGHGPVLTGSVGQPTGVRIIVVDRQGRELPTGQIGEVWVKGPTVARGYLDNPAETAKSFTDGWFHTGDLGMLDDQGNLTLTGRIKEQINRGGEKISPVRVEAVLQHCPGVIEAAVFGVPDPKYGQRVEAAITAKPGLDVKDVLAACRRQLAPCEVPDHIKIVSTLPHTAKGALDRRAISQQWAGNA